MSRFEQTQVRPVTVARLMELLGSLAQLTREGHTQWRLDVVWSGATAPWYVEMCRRRVADLDLAGRVLFRPGAGLATTTGVSSLPAPSDDNHLVLMLEPMHDRRSDRDADTSRVFTSTPHHPAPTRVPSLDLAAGLIGAPDDALLAHRRVAAAYQAVAEPADPYRRRLVDAVA